MRPEVPMQCSHQSSTAQTVERLKALYELSMTLSGDPVDIFQQAARMIGELLDVRVVCLSEVRGDELHFLSVYIDGQVVTDAGHCPLAITPCATVERTKDIRTFDRVAERFPEASFLEQHNAFAYCGFPSLDNNGNVVAVTCLLDDKPHDFSREDQDLLRSFGQRIGMEFERRKHLEDGRRADVALRERETRLFQAQRLAKLAYWRWSFAEGQLVDWSQEYAGIMGLPNDEIQNLNYFSRRHLHPEDRERVLQEYAAADAEQHGFELEYRIVLPDGGVRYIHEIAEIEYDNCGQPVGQIGTVQDVTDRKRAETALRQSEVRLAGILRIAPEAIISVDDGNRIQLFNEGAESIFGYRAAEVIGQPLDMLLPARFRKTHAKHIADFDHAHNTSRMMTERPEVMALRRDGAEFPAEASISRLELASGTIFTVILRDVSERKVAEQAMLSAMDEVELANRTKSEFLANMSHELRTPLNAMIGFAELINDETFGPIGNPQYRDYLKDIHGAGQHLLELINDILDLSKVESGNAKPHEEDIDVSTVIQSCLRLMNERACKNGVELVADVADLQPALRTDRRMLKQIVINLLSNAVKFTLAGGKITIKVWHNPDSGHVVQVIDTGIGIAFGQIPKALARFGQVDSGLERKFEGTGLGLPLTKALVELHGGSLDLQSEVGVGTTVTVRFPAERAVRSPRGVKTPDINDRVAS